MPIDPLLAIVTALSCPRRLHVLRLLGHGGMSVSAVALAVGVSLSTASWHLHRLVDAGLATRHRAGRERIYKWPPTRVELVVREAL